MARYKMRADAGVHIGGDPAWKFGDDGKWHKAGHDPQEVQPSTEFGPGKPGGIFVESDRDLAAEFPNKFDLVSGSVEKEKLPAMAPADLGGPVAAAPGGQVSEGHQVTTTDSLGRQVSGPMTVDSAPRTRKEKLQRDNREDEDEDDR